jgi:eukaryotic-like serine/threonine-protein kinase
VTELLEGESLRSRLEGGALPQRRAIEIAVQIARGLGAAHERGILHRDVKPENVFVTSDGRIKLLDFGLAKVVSKESAETSAPTEAAGTEPGTVLGTVGYMSPEQVRGKDLDERTDIFSFGAVLYEMLSGKRAFRGDSQVETMNAILKEEPPELLESGHAVSPGLDRIVRHCLEKTPEARFHSAGDVAFALEALSESAAALPSGRVGQVRMPRSFRPALIAGALAAAVGAGVLLDRATRAPFSSPSFQRLTSRRGTISNARFASDGRTVVYSAQWEGKPSEVFSVSAAAQESRALGFGSATLLAVSPSDELALKLRPQFWSLQLHGTLAKAPLSGGTPRELREDVENADFRPDGAALALVRLVGGMKTEIEYPEGKRFLEDQSFVRAVRISPDGARIVVADGLPPWAKASVFVADAAGVRRTLSSDLATGLAWTRDGKGIWLTSESSDGSTQVWALDLSGRRRLVLRAPGALALQDIAKNGDVLVSVARRQASVIYHAAAASRDVDLAWHAASRAVDLSLDGRFLLLSEGPGPGDFFYLRGTDGSTAVRLGEGTANQLSTDAKWVIAQDTNALKDVLFVPTGAGQVRRVSLPVAVSQVWLTPDGRRIVMAGILADGRAQGFTADADGKNFRAITPPDFDSYIGEMPISPDGKLVALNGGRTSDVSLKIFSVDGGPPRDVPGFEKDDVVIRWAEDGRALFVFKRNEIPARVFRLDVESGRRTPWLELMPADPAGVDRIPTVVLSPDGKSYAYSFTRELADLYLIRGLR